MTLEERFEAARLAEEAKNKPKEPTPVEKKFEEAATAGKPPPLSGNEVMGDNLSNTISLGLLDKIRGPMASFVNRVNQVGAPSVPQLPEPSSEDVTAQIKRGEDERPGAASAGKAAGRGIQALAMAPLLPFTGPAAVGAATAGVPAAAENAIAYGRGRKSGGEAFADTAIETGLGAVGGKVAHGVSSALQPTTKIASMPKAAIEAQAARPLTPPLTAAADELRSVPGLLRTAMMGGGGAYGGGIKGAAASAIPPVLAGARQVGQNTGTVTAQDALSMLEQNPTLVTQIAGSRTAFERFVQALLAGGGSVASDAAIPN